ncbi:transcription factor ILR3-like [Olea europaea subsp. europaea]|uniref:Transcription factor ILR3-like n=1 Tax=Olea europaea subsp. europaea TaxID=158383 RepID=A0A8S0R425_OLEEU|nr:transcription factor ILR3-like [Olea europaea subsp. europaea]
MEVSSTENSNVTTNWLCDYELMDGISAVSAAADFPSLTTPPPSTATVGFAWPAKAISCISIVSSELDCSFQDAEGFKEVGPRKRLKFESCNASRSKACREKLRRDRLNERYYFSFLTFLRVCHLHFHSSLTIWLRFLELGSILEPGKPPKADKCALLCDAVRMVTQLRVEAQRLKESNQDLLEKIKELKAEKKELRDEKLRLKADKEKLELQVKASAAQAGLLAHQSAMGVAFAKEEGNKLMPFFGYPGVAMWQFMQPAVVDTSQDHVLRPPVA